MSKLSHIIIGTIAPILCFIAGMALIVNGKTEQALLFLILGWVIRIYAKLDERKDDA